MGTIDEQIGRDPIRLPDVPANSPGLSSLRMCRDTDVRERQVSITPDGQYANLLNYNFIHDPTHPERLMSVAGTLSLSDSHAARLFSGLNGRIPNFSTNGMRAMVTVGSGDNSTVTPATMNLCRVSVPASQERPAQENVYLVRDSVLNNYCQPSGSLNPVMRPIVRDQGQGPMHFTNSELLGLIEGSSVLNNEAYYCISRTDPTQLSIDTNLLQSRALQNWIQGSTTVFSAGRRDEVITALNWSHRTDAMQRENLNESLRMPPWLLTLIGGALGVVPSIALARWQMGQQMAMMERQMEVQRVMMQEQMARQETLMRELQTQNEALMRELQKGPQSNIANLYRNITQSLLDRAAGGGSSAVGQERYLELMRQAFNRAQYPHVIISGPSGSGKSYTAELTGELATTHQGLLSIGRFQNGVRFAQVDVAKIINEAGSWMNKGQELWLKVLEELGSEPTIIHVLEADRLAKAGMGANNTHLNLVPDLLTIMEGKTPQHKNLFFILDSTRWQTLYEAAPDIARRVVFIEMTPPTPDQVRRTLDIGINMRRANQSDAEVRERYQRVQFTPEALDAITALGSYKDGAPPSSHLILLDALAEQADSYRASQANGVPAPATITVDREHVLRMVAQDRFLSVDQVRQTLNELLSHGPLKTNQAVQSPISEGFYRAYPQPRNGMVNPLDPNVQTAREAPNIFSPSYTGPSMPQQGAGHTGNVVDLNSRRPGAQPQPQAPAQPQTPAPAAAPPPPPPPPAAGAQGNAALFTVDHFAAEIGERYGLSQNGIVHPEIAPILNTLAQMSRDAWINHHGARVDTVSLPGRTARIFPEAVIESVVHQYHQGLLDQGNPNHSLFTQGLGRNRAMRGFGSLPDIVRDAAFHAGRP